ncbi:MAG: hypothetical protein U0637_05760 [Phycisphaerales bacterium]
MITPHPTAPISPLLARGTLGAVTPATATRPAFLTFLIPNTNYELHLEPSGEVSGQVGRRLVGTIRVHARRIDVTRTGGQFIDPVYGRPRRMQGTVTAIHEGSLVVDVGTSVHVVPTDPRQTAEDFQVGQFVGFDIRDASTFTPAV